ncbi:hypothetical protein J7L87_05235, partial [bacterium]|nr:hypothetical protein [bacterium]
MIKYIKIFYVLVIFSRILSAQNGQKIFPVSPYVDSSQLNVPWPKHSFYKIPWRAYLETVPGINFLNGIGFNYTIPERANQDVLVRMLAESGFKRARIEISWCCINWEETGLRKDCEKIFLRELAACKKYNIRPLILLNAHHGYPCPAMEFRKKVVKDAPSGSRKLVL